MAEIVGQRVDTLRRRRGLTQQALAELVGVTQPTIGRIISGETKETFKLPELVRALGTNPEFLTGQSDDDGQSPQSEVQINFQLSGPERDPDEVEIDTIDLAFGMGGTFLDADDVEVRKARFSRSWLRQFTPAPPHLLVSTQGVGDSMMPTILDGDVVIIDRSESQPEFGDKIWAIKFGGVGMIKRLRPMPDGTMKISSDNQLVRDDIAADGELYIVGRVVAIVRKV